MDPDDRLHNNNRRLKFLKIGEETFLGLACAKCKHRRRYTKDNRCTTCGGFKMDCPPAPKPTKKTLANWDGYVE